MHTTLQTLWQGTHEGESVRQRLFHVLRQSIIQMVLAPGQALSEKELADTFSVSRQPVREAFIRLSESGLVEVRPQRGTYVVRISRQAVLEARFIRESLEVSIVREATKQPLQSGVLMELNELIDRQRSCIERQDHDRFFFLDEMFHRTLALATGQTMAWNVIEDVKAQLDRVRYLSIPDSTPIPKLADQHQAIVDAISAGDTDAAVQAMSIHQCEILHSLPELEHRFPELFEGVSMNVHALTI
ncbi:MULTISPECIES: GntR family transcriptional regulator [Halomonadaceae]|jgi:DNA-binding GntR family transcriptional regulator|uniref:GntR family transcriptional regulator n=1 Tax=Halomonadaceae TaxID=28256 RepID=UPI000349BDF7|nr:MULTISPECIES: GntR family transcriptional regulator [Halomonas]QGQ70077.1 GntR family transcriptional regulator [Halomonas sp. PA16-9]UEQ05792.1 GntR family transcriptional regulator [Halomonas profundus]KIN16453.1 GntR family transcriptional regulator [Halomonas sp. KHS3]MCD1585490.1 GntR family transcriptional regulator [Halomonas sp. IOP_14]MCE7519446.1 GntR family transcriptional regulator [Halomonas titanicae]|tara:strand:+ start:1596 stop:2327 length:732 start_codon:yes stop_codon:yes gene_type:complete